MNTHSLTWTHTHITLLHTEINPGGHLCEEPTDILTADWPHTAALSRIWHTHSLSDDSPASLSPAWWETPAAQTEVSSSSCLYHDDSRSVTRAQLTNRDRFLVKLACSRPPPGGAASWEQHQIMFNIHLKYILNIWNLKLYLFMYSQ